MDLKPEARLNPPVLLTRKEIWFALTASLVLGTSLAMGFQPTAMRLFTWLSSVFSFPVDPWSRAAFPTLAFLFWASLPTEKRTPCELTLASQARLLFLPALIALAYGFCRPAFGEVTPSDLLWTWVCIPLGEEWLFRGWLMQVLRRVFSDRLVTFTSPFPIAVWGSALAFSLWHAQNWEYLSPALLTFQLAYTFVTGIWLGYLRWKTGSLIPGIVAHCLINVLSDLPRM